MTAGAAACHTVQTVEHLCIATHDYEMTGRGFLPIKSQDLLYVMEADASGWWMGSNLEGRKGVFPSTYTLPYSFPAPSPGIAHEVRLMRAAQRCGIDYTTGVPLPLTRGDMLAVRRETYVSESLKSVDDVYKALDTFILQREEARHNVSDLLKELCAALESAYSPQVEGAADETSAGGSAPQQNASETVQNTSEEAACEVQNECAAVEEAVRLAKDDALAAGKVPSREWYERAARLVPDAPALPSIVTDVKRVIADSEEELSALAAETERLQADYERRKDSLVQRIALRDALVTEMVAYWAQKAEESKSDYLCAKAEFTRVAGETAREEEKMRQFAEEGKAEFADISQQLAADKRKMKEIRAVLERKSELDDIQAQLDTINTAMRHLRRKARA